MIYPNGPVESAWGAVPGLLLARPIGQQELKVACRPGSGWAVASVSPDRIQAGSPQGAPAWVAKIQRIKSQD